MSLIHTISWTTALSSILKYTLTIISIITFSLFVQANNRLSEYSNHEFSVSEYGELTMFAKSVFNNLHIIPPSNLARQSFSNSVIYINSQANLSTYDLKRIRSALSTGAIIILDNTMNNIGTDSLSARIGGIGFNSPVLMIRNSNRQTPEYKLLDFDLTEGIHSALNHHQNAINNIAEEAVSILYNWKNNPAKQHIHHRKNDVEDRYRPETTINVEYRHTGFNCMVGKSYEGNGITGHSQWTDEMVDACDGNASVSLFYTIDLIRSVSNDDGSTEDAKYLRITLNPSGDGGAGWHFTDTPTHKSLWYESLTNRIEWFGPIVEDYSMTISARDPDIRLYQAVPENTPQHSNIVTLPSIGIGVKVPYGLRLPAPAITGLGSGLSSGFTTDRAVIYKNHEYTIINRSSDTNHAIASWLWTREFDKYSESWRTNSTCLLWCDDPFFNDNAFSPAAYAHFEPGFSATFKASGEKSGQSTFLLTGTANVVALAGRVQYKFVLQHYAPWSRKGTNQSFSQRLRVNWDSIFFNPDIPISIEALRENSGSGLCLNIIESDIDDGIGRLNLYDCHFNPNQIWGVDAEDHYKSYLSKGICLTKETDDTISVRNCTNSANQKWTWQNNYLINNHSGYLTANIDGDITVTSDPLHATEWRGYIRRADSSNILDIQSLPIDQNIYNAIHDNAIINP